MNEDILTSEDIEKYERRYSFADISGRKFSPARLEIEFNLELFDKIEPGEKKLYLPKKNPFYNQASESGSAILQPPTNVRLQRDWVIKKLDFLKPNFKKLGIQEITYWELIFCLPNSQKNIALSSKHMKILGCIGSNYCISIYNIDNENDKILRKRYYYRRMKNG